MPILPLLKGSPPADWAGLVAHHAPLAWYRQGEPSATTTLVDSSSNGRNGTYSSSTIPGAPSLTPSDPNTAASYSGSNEAAVVHAAWMNVANLTLFAWIKTSTTGAIQSIWDRDNDSGARQFQFRVKASGVLEFIHLGGAVGFCAGTTVLTDGTARFVAATFDGSNMKVYVNGAQEGITPFTAALPSVSWRLTLGVHGNPSSQRFTGVIDEAGFYGTALTAAQIADLYNAGISGPPPSGPTSVTSTRSTTWDVNASVTSGRSSTWDTLATVTASRAATWDVRTVSTSNRNTTWRVAARVTASRSTTWHTKATASTSRAATWDTRARIERALATTWDARANVTAQRSSSWNVDSAILTVTASRATTWRTLARPAAARSTTWDVNTSVVNARTSAWGTRATVARQTATAWRTLAAPVVVRAATWRTLQTTHVERDTTWLVFSDAPPLVAPPERTLIVPAEARVLKVSAEARTLVVGPETRVLVVAAETRTQTVPAENRTLEA